MGCAAIFFWLFSVLLVSSQEAGVLKLSPLPGLITTVCSVFTGVHGLATFCTVVIGVCLFVCVFVLSSESGVSLALYQIHLR